MLMLIANGEAHIHALYLPKTLDDNYWTSVIN